MGTALSYVTPTNGCSSCLGKQVRGENMPPLLSFSGWKRKSTNVVVDVIFLGVVYDLPRDIEKLSLLFRIFYLFVSRVFVRACRHVLLSAQVYIL